MAQHQVWDGARGRLCSGLPVRQRRLDVDGAVTSLLEGGQGSPIVLLHGGTQAGGFVWWRVLARLAERRRILAPDLPGLGLSEPRPRLDAAQFTAWLARLLALTCNEPATVVAHSATGALAARFAAEHGGRLRRLVLVDAAGLARFRPSPGFVAALVRSSLRPSAASVERFLARVVADVDGVRRADGERWEAFLAEAAARAAASPAKRAMRELVRAGTKPLSGDELAAVGVPTGLLWGRADPMFPVAVAEAASATLRWPLRVVDGAGHLPHVEQPEGFLDALAGLEAGP